MQLTGNLTCDRLTMRLRDSPGGALCEALDQFGFSVDWATTAASTEPETIVLEGPDIRSIRIGLHGVAHLLEICVEPSAP